MKSPTYFEKVWRTFKTAGPSSIGPVYYTNVAQPWQPGKLRRFPWAGFGCLMGALCGLIAGIAILIISHGDPIADWKIQPTFFLSVAYTMTNVLLAAALAQGTTIAWWKKAIGEHTTLLDLHNWWAFSTGIKDVLLAGRKTNLVAVAAFLVAIAPLNGPLFQRASTIRLQSANTSGSLIQISAVQTIVNGTGYITGRNYQPGFLTPQFMPVVRAFYDGDDIVAFNTGCPANGRCTGRLLAAGFAINCSTKTISFNNTSGVAPGGALTGYPVNTVFQTGMDWSRDNPLTLNISIIQKDTSECEGVLLSKQCTLRVAIVKYPVVIDGSRKSIFLDPNFDSFHDEPVDIPPQASSESDGGSLLSGFRDTLQSRYGSLLTMMYTGTRGWSMNSNGNAMLVQFTDYNAMEQYGGLSSALASLKGCHLRFDDPIDYVLNKTRELMFRKALADAQEDITTTQTIPADVLLTTNVYHTDIGIMSIAVALTVLTTFAVSTTFWEYWVIGRNVSMSPVEIAKAFNAPLFRDLDDNSDAKQIVRATGGKAVRYGIVPAPTSVGLKKDRPREVSGNCDTEGPDSSGMVHMEIAEREVVQAL